MLIDSVFFLSALVKTQEASRGRVVVDLLTNCFVKLATVFKLTRPGSSSTFQYFFKTIFFTAFEKQL